jgi:uncharacterized protein
VTTVFVDTSALVALLNQDDDVHDRAAAAFAHLRARQAMLLTTSYVLVETYALLGRRLGVDAVQSFRADFAPLMRVVWVDEQLHDAGLDILAERGRRQWSLVDAVSFVTMREHGVDEAFAFDQHFGQEGFATVS